jgi:hypothetical protein
MPRLACRLGRSDANPDQGVFGLIVSVTLCQLVSALGRRVALKSSARPIPGRAKGTGAPERGFIFHVGYEPYIPLLSVKAERSGNILLTF